MNLRQFGPSTIPLLALMLASPALAQSAPQGRQDDADNDGDIVVTATRLPTKLQDTPIAITAVTSEQLEERGVKSVADLSAVVPNAQFRRVQGAFGPGVTTFIRGLGTTDTSLGGEAAVAYYIDDVYYPILLGSNFDLLDIDHIEVLRGPQGTLFGRNALAGAVNIVSKQPEFGEASGYADVTVGEYNRHDLRAGFNLPLGDNAAVMISGVSKERRGYQRVLDFTCELRRRGTPQLAGTFPLYDPQLASNPSFTPDNCVIGHQGGEDVRALRGSFRWRPIDSVTLTLSADKTWDNSENPADTLVNINTTGLPAWITSQAAFFGMTYDQRFMTGDPFKTYVSYVDRIAPGTVVPNSAFYNGRATRGGNIIDPINHLRHWGVSGKLEWGLAPDIDLTLIYGHREMDETHAFDNDGGVLVGEHVASAIGEHYDNAEVRLAGRTGWADWVVGAFYFDAFGYFHATNYSVVGSAVRAVDTTYEPNSKALYANATLHPFDVPLSLVLGGRYSWDHKFVDYTNYNDVPPHPNSSDIIFQVEPRQRKFNWKVGLNYEVTEDVLLYASVATGNSLPGYNPRPLQPSHIVQFDGNDDRAYEMGAKLDLFDRRARFNLAAFYTDFNNRPTGIGGADALIDPNTGQPAVGNQQLIPLEGGPAGSTRCSPTTVPAGTGIVCLTRTYYVNVPATVRGAELEYTLNPIDRLTINGAVGWSKFKSPDIAARTVNRRQGNPFWTANAGIQYEIPAEVLHGTVTPRFDWAYQSSEVISGTSTKYNALNGARSIFNARLTYENQDYDFTVAGGVTNLFNKFYYLNWFDYQAFGRPNTEAQPGAPRQWYVTVSKRF